ncbi:hypothetical protein HDU76_013249 [Blyttiomyces sp. JEL0837]|nr:hypothetical protein HDU76_013249 [Blyttiomyces sp. JEL0837]
MKAYFDLLTRYLRIILPSRLANLSETLFTQLQQELEPAPSTSTHAAIDGDECFPFENYADEDGAPMPSFDNEKPSVVFATQYFKTHHTTSNVKDSAVHLHDVENYADVEPHNEDRGMSIISKIASSNEADMKAGKGVSSEPDQQTPSMPNSRHYGGGQDHEKPEDDDTVQATQVMSTGSIQRNELGLPVETILEVIKSLAIRDIITFGKHLFNR